MTLETYDLDRPLAASWQAFDALCVHPDATPLERLRLRQAFYGGLQAMLTLLHHIADLHDPLRAEVMHTLDRELVAHRLTHGRTMGAPR